MSEDRVGRRRAIEALRAGVPNRDVVRELKPVQADIEDRFETLLENATALWPEGKQPPGILLEGDFGTGKSHWLEYFQHRALELGFVCSRIVLNKETPLYDLGKVYRACVESAVAPDKSGPALEEIALTFRGESAPHYRELFEWTHQGKDLDPRIPATLLLFERNTDPEVRQRVLEEWTGYPMRVGDLRAALKDIGEMAVAARVTRPVKVQLTRRFEFLSRFFLSAGYAGWVVLLDETEMVSRYSLRQRGRAYAHLGQLLGLVKGATIPGLASVFTITKDYTGQVLLGRKNDLVNIPARLPGTRDEELVPAAEAGMKAIKGKGTELRPPTRQEVDGIYSRVRALYGDAYQWDAPELEDRREYSAVTGMRQYIRSWINTWDLRRLYGYEADLVAENVAISYEEDADLQVPPPEEEPEIVL